MRVVMFVHSIRSDWNHGNAHFLRGVCTELQGRGHAVRVFEPRDGWSARCLAETEGAAALTAYRERYPTVAAELYDPAHLESVLDEALDGADLVLVHEWNPPALVAAIGQRRARGGGFRALFHDTHHRSLSRRDEIAGLDLSAYDGVLAFGAVIRDYYQRLGWGWRAWTWHEAADTRVFRPAPDAPGRAGLVWIGNWGDGERSAELHEFLLDPARALDLGGTVHGVRYPADAAAAVEGAGLAYRGYLPNHRAPDVFARHAMTVHVPRRPYATSLPGIPTIRMFEALACGIPLVSAPWDDVEGLFAAGEDYLRARSGTEMRARLDELRKDPDRAAAIASRGLATIHARHTCAHRVNELLLIAVRLGVRGSGSLVA